MSEAKKHKRQFRPGPKVVAKAPLEKTVVELDGKRLGTHKAFHETCAEVLGFPAFYGRNMDAWIDCMSDIDDPEMSLAKTTVAKGDVLTIWLRNAGWLKHNAREIYDDLMECVAFVNHRRLENGNTAVIALAFHDWEKDYKKRG